MACHRINKVYTKVEFPLDGSLVIHDSKNGGWIEVFDHLNNTLYYWYRCGKKMEWHYHYISGYRLDLV